MAPNAVTVRTPATVGNFGPGFDVTSLALAWGGDTVTARPAQEDRVQVSGPGGRGVPTDWEANAAAIAFTAVRARLGRDDGAVLVVEKGVPPGSGLGSSASSAAAGALAAARLLAPERPWTTLELHAAACEAEGLVAGRHGDDVAAALLGGLAFVRAGGLARLDPPDGLAVAIVRPHLSLPTREMRGLVPEAVPVADAVGNLADLAFLIRAFVAGDAAGVASSLSDRIAAPHRVAKLPFFAAALEAARNAGCARIAISGSGPALFTVTEDLSTARAVADAMTEAVVATGVPAEPIACLPEARHVWRDALS